MRKGIVYFLLSTLLMSEGLSQKKAIYTMFLQYPVPENGTEVVFNAPVLRWPYQKGKQVTYEVALSLDKEFPGNATISEKGLKGAIFHPHQALAIGKWYWHYRVSGKEWSDLCYFTITPEALPMVTPAASVFLSKIPQQHPRILLNDPSANISGLKGEQDAKAILAEADLALAQAIPTEADAMPAGKSDDEKQMKKIQQDAVVALGNHVNQMALVLSQAYLLTGKPVYADKAIAVGDEVAKWDAGGITSTSDFTDGISMYTMALVYDTYFDKLSDIQKTILQKAIRVRAGKFYRSWLNNIESKVLSGHVWQLLLNEFFKTALALYHHEPEAANWLSYAYDLFLNRAPVLGGLDGGWAEGASYFQMNMETLIEIPEKIKYYTGFDFIKQHPWYQKQADWMIYQFPVASSADGYGDNTEELFEPPASYAAFADVMARLTQNPKYAWYLSQLQRQETIELSKDRHLRWFRLLSARQIPLPGGADTLRFPMAQLSREVGVASLHTHPENTKQDIMLSMRSSPFGAYGHILADQNTFNILVGGKRLFYRTGYKVAMDDPHRLGWSKHTKSQNGILINGEGQPYSAEAYANFSRFLQGQELAYLKGDGAHAYQSVETREDYGVKTFNRHVVMLKPGIVVIYDELASVADARWSWLIHSLENMRLDSLHNTFTATIENARGVGKLWSSQPFQWQISNKFDVPAVIFRNYKGMRTKRYDDNQWHLKAINTNPADQVRFLSVIQISKDGKVLPWKETKTANGATQVIVGGWIIEATLSETLAPQLNIRSVSGNTAFSAYDPGIIFHHQLYTGKSESSSKLVEMVNGKTVFKETSDVPVAPIR